MKLTKDTLIEGSIIPKGTEVRIKEERTDYEKEIVYMTRDEYKKAHRDYKGSFGKDKPYILRMGKGGTTTFPVEFID